jgi:hypothetical protein
MKKEPLLERILAKELYEIKLNCPKTSSKKERFIFSVKAFKRILEGSQDIEVVASCCRIKEDFKYYSVGVLSFPKDIFAFQERLKNEGYDIELKQYGCVKKY